MPSISLIAAVDSVGAIGKEGALPWHLPADMRHFKALTLGHAVLMGRRTFDSIGFVLPGRTSIVLTRSQDWEYDGVIAVGSIEEGITKAFELVPDKTLFVLGGEEIYRQTIGLADTLEITHVPVTVEDPDAFFPEIDPALWECIKTDEVDSLTFATYTRYGAAT